MILQLSGSVENIIRFSIPRSCFSEYKVVRYKKVGPVGKFGHFSDHRAVFEPGAMCYIFFCHSWARLTEISKLWGKKKKKKCFYSQSVQAEKCCFSLCGKALDDCYHEGSRDHVIPVLQLQIEADRCEFLWPISLEIRAAEGR